MGRKRAYTDEDKERDDGASMSAWHNKIVGYGEEAPDQLLAHPQNWRIHPKHQTDALAGVLRDVGIVQNIIVNRRTGYVVDGHARVALALRDGQASLPVTYVDLSEAEEAEILTTLDPISAMAAAEAAKLEELLREVSTGEAAVQAMLDGLAQQHGIVPGIEPGGGGDEFDATPDESGPTRCQLGDLWIIGGVHRLLVGDCTDAANVARLMDGERADVVFTDPPYGVSYSGLGQSTKHQTIENDDLDLPALKQFLLDVFACADNIMREGCVCYVCHADRPRGTRPVFETAFTETGWKFSATIIWVKQQASMGWQDYRAQHEPLLYGWKRGDHYYCGDRAQTTVWNISRDAAATYEHPTQKPVALSERAIRNSSQVNNIIYDPFLGSGTTLIAAQRTGRRCYGMEIEPRYGDVILRRADAEGLTVELDGERREPYSA